MNGYAKIHGNLEYKTARCSVNWTVMARHLLTRYPWADLDPFTFKSACLDGQERSYPCPAIILFLEKNLVLFVSMTHFFKMRHCSLSHFQQVKKLPSML